jgi:hypothetical protein
MSTRLGMADGRCFTISTADSLFNNYVMEQNKIPFVDNYSYRQLLQKQGPVVVDRIVNAVQPTNAKMRGSPLCTECNVPIIKVPNLY